MLAEPTSVNRKRRKRSASWSRCCLACFLFLLSFFVVDFVSVSFVLLSFVLFCVLLAFWILPCFCLLWFFLCASALLSSALLLLRVAPQIPGRLALCAVLWRFCFGCAALLWLLLPVAAGLAPDRTVAVVALPGRAAALLWPCCFLLIVVWVAFCFGCFFALLWPALRSWLLLLLASKSALLRLLLWLRFCASVVFVK